MADILTNETKQDYALPENQQKAGAFSAFAFNVDEKGNMLPTSSLGSEDTSAVSVIKSYTAAEAITKQDAVYLNNILEQSDVGGASHVKFGGNTVAPRKCSQSFVPTRTIQVSSLEVRVGDDTGNSAVAVTIAIHTDRDGTALASGTIPAASIGADANFTVTLSSTITLSLGTTYYIVYSAGADDANYYGAAGTNTDSYAAGTAATYDTVSWTDVGSSVDVHFKIFSNEGYIRRADASAAATANGFIGFALEDIIATQTGKIQQLGITEGFTGLTVGSQYYLSDTTGAISTSVGTVTRKVGIAVSNTELLITNIW